MHYAGGTWTTETVSSTTGIGPRAVQLADTGAGIALTLGSLGYSLFTRAGGTWTAGPTNVFASQTQVGVATNGAGEGIFGYLTSGPQVYRHLGDGGWTGPTATTGSNMGASACDLPVTVTASGDAFLTQCPQSSNAIETIAFRKDGGAWGAPSRVGDAGGGYVPGYDSVGDTVTTFTNSSAMIGMASYSADGGGWSGTTTLSGVTNSGSIAFLSANGRAWVAWSEGGAYKVQKVQ